jgi:hypothetical protein
MSEQLQQADQNLQSIQTRLSSIPPGHDVELSEVLRIIAELTGIVFTVLEHVRK